MNIRNYKKEDLEEIFLNSKSYSDFLNRIDYAKSGSSYKYTKDYLKSIGLNPESLINKRWDTSEKSIEDSFIINSSLGTKELKNKILKYNLIEYKCFNCNNTGEWLGEKLSLHLDHINGIRNDSRLCNLRLLCPNCHSQTETYSGKNKIK